MGEVRPIFTRTPILRGPPAPNREFPDELFNAATPTEVPGAARVDLVHSGRFREDGNIRGPVAGSTVRLVLELPRSASSATGTLDDAPIDVTWSLSDNSTGDPELKATLQGTIGTKRVDLRGVFHFGPGYWFDEATVQGTLADATLAVSIERAFGAFDTSDTIVATGTLADQHFEIFAAFDGSRRGLARGTYDGQTIHLDVTASLGGDAHLQGTCPSPPSFALLLAASLLFFA